MEQTASHYPLQFIQYDSIFIFQYLPKDTIFDANRCDSLFCTQNFQFIPRNSPSSHKQTLNYLFQNI